MTDACLPRTRANLIAAVHDADLEHNFLAADGLTHCNQAVRAILASLGVLIPPLLANELAKWFPIEGRLDGWMPSDEREAQWCAERGCPVVAIWTNPDPLHHGHCAIVVPSDSPGIHIAQAGQTNFSSKPLAAGFGHLHPTYFAHP